MKATWIAMLAILLVSIAPVALAQDVSVDTSVDASVQVGATVGSDDADSDDGSKREEMREKGKEMREQYQETRGVAKDVRAIVAGARGEMKERHEALKAIGMELQQCKGKKTEDCEQKRKDAKLAAKDVLEGASADVTALLEAAKARIAGSDLANKDAIIADIGAQIQAIATAKAKVDALSETSTKQEVKAASKELRDAMQKAKRSLKKGAHGLVATRLGGVLQKSKHLEVRLEKALAKLAAKGVDTASVDLSAFKAKLDEASKLHAEAVAAFEKAKTAEESMKDELMKEATDKLRASHKALKEAHAMLRDLLRSLKGLRGGGEALTEASAEASTETAETTTETSTETTVETSVENTVEVGTDASTSTDTSTAVQENATA